MVYEPGGAVAVPTVMVAAVDETDTPENVAAGPLYATVCGPGDVGDK
jgi:hypothetical protein